MDELHVFQSDAADGINVVGAGGTAAQGSRPLSRRGLLGTIAGLTTGVVASWAAACGAGGGAAGMGEAPRLTKENITLRLSAWGSQEEADVWQKVADAYSAKRPNIKASFEHYPNSYEQKVYSLAVAGDAPHVMSIQDEPFPEFVTKGLYMDITALAKRDAKEMSFDDFWPRWLDMFRWDESLQRTNVSSGKLYAIPWDGGNILWFYNKDAFDRYGVPYPKKDWTWEDFVDICRKLTRRNPDGSAQQVAYNWPGAIYSMPFIWTLGQDYLYLDKDYKKCELDKPGSFFAHEQLWRLAHDWKVVRLSTDFQGEQNLFETGKYAMMITGPWSFPGLRRYEGETGWQNWDIAPMWSYKGKRQTRQTPDAVANWSQTKYPEEGWDLIKFIAADGAHSGATRRGWLRWRREGA